MVLLCQINLQFLCEVKEKVKTSFEKKADMDEESWSRVLFNSHSHVSNLIKKFAKFVLILE